MRIKKGFTLAEVLIALTLIGVITTLTIPSIISSTDKNKKIAAAKKAYNVASSAYVKSVSEKSGITNLTDLANEMAKHMNVKFYISKDDNTTKTNEPATATTTTTGSGKKKVTTTTPATESNWIVTEDGIGYKIKKSEGFEDNQVCTLDKVTFNTNATFENTMYCYEIEIDLDGPTKGDQADATVAIDNTNNNNKISGIAGERFLVYITEQGVTAGNTSWTNASEKQMAMAKLLESND